MPTVRFAHRDLDLGGPHLGLLRDSNALLDDPAALRARLAEDGYLLVRGLHDRGQVQAGARRMVQVLKAKGKVAADAGDLDTRIAPGAGGSFGDPEITAAPEFRAVVEAPRLMAFFQRLLDAPAMTFSYKWFRVVGQGDFTGAHVDNVYMGRGGGDLYTVWTPWVDLSYAMGPLAICVGSHRAEGFARVRETYGRMDVDRDHVQGHFSDDPLEMVERFGARWATAEFQAGDALVFGMQTMHASLTNVSDRYRLTSDTRYQRAADRADERWVGDKPIGHYDWQNPAKRVEMAEARRGWGLG